MRLSDAPLITPSKLVAAGCFAVALCLGAVAQSVPQIKDGQVVGSGFTVTLPAGVNAQVGANSESEHGFYIELSGPQAANNSLYQLHPTKPHSYRYIAFDTRWDIGDMPSLDAAVDALTLHIGEAVPSYIVDSGDIVLAGNFPTRLGGLPARRLILKFKNNDRKPSVRQMIVAYDARKDASAIVYVLVLNTTEQNFDEDMGVFGKIVAGFKLSDH